MQRIKKIGFILFLILIFITAAVFIYYYFFYKTPIYGGYFVFNKLGNEVNYGYIY